MMYLRMHAKWLLTFSVFFLLLFTTQSCSTNPEKVYTVEIANESTSAITVKGFLYGKLQSEEIALTGKVALKKNFSELYFASYFHPTCKLDSISIIFDDGKGYFTTNQEDSKRKKSLRPSPFLGEVQNFRKVGKNHYQYVITEEHYKNAHVLP